MILSDRIKNIAPSATLAIDAKAKKMKEEGIDVVGFGAGEPDFDTPQNIKDAGINAIQKGVTKYTPVGGLLKLKEAVCIKFEKDNNLKYTPSNIVVSCGAKHSLYNIIQCIVNPGDEVIIPIPYWVSYPEMVRMAGGVPKFVETFEKDNFILSKESFISNITSRTKAIILNSPSNPSGMIYTKQELMEIAKVAVEKNILIISDEIYEKLIYDGISYLSIASLGEDVKNTTVVVNGVSKAYSMTGWRIGYIACSVELAKAIDNFQSHSTSNATSISQAASIEALLGSQDKVSEMRQAFEQRRKIMVDLLNDIPDITCKMPQGAFYAFPNISKIFGKTFNNNKIISSEQVTEFFLEEAKVALVQGSAFGTNNHIRLSYATSQENIEKGLSRMKEALKKLKS